MRIHALILVSAVAGAMSAAQANQATGACDRACLISIAEQYVDALVAKDPKRLPLAAAAR